MKFISWNVNGIRAAVKKGFIEKFNEIDADIFALQETKLQEGQIELDLPGYYQYWNCAERKGYSGTAIFTKHKPINVVNGIDVEKHDNEGRVITLEYDNYYIVTVYTPNSKRDLLRLDDRMDFENCIREYLINLAKEKHVILCGDLNVAHKEIDLKNPKSNTRNAGFTFEERSKMTDLLENDFVDTFRQLYPNKEGAYSWWSYRKGVREKNVGWRLDYFIISKSLLPHIDNAFILPEIYGSDHCPVGLTLDLDN